jgi:predicted lipoprotein
MKSPAWLMLAGMSTALLGTTLAVLGGACTTDDPRAGTRQGASSTSSGGSSTSGSGGTSSSGGLADAAIPEQAIDCGAQPAATASFSKQALLAAAADCSAWHACNFQNAATKLRSSVKDTTADATKIEATRAAWKAAMDSWSAIELFQFGPIGSKTVDPYHGRGLRAFINPWPQTSRCEVEKQIATKPYKDQGIGSVLPAARGLFALEYIFFYPNTDTACLPASPTGQAWSTLASSPANLTAAKNEYANAVADNLAALSLEIRNVWLPQGENFKSKLAGSYEGYGSDQEALNIVGWSLFYIEKDVKDLKLAVRAGVDPGSPNPETPFAQVEIENIRANLRASRRLFQGCGPNNEGVGFDDWLIATNVPDLANEMLAALTQAQTAADAFPSFTTATQAQFLQLYEAIRPFSTLLKTRLFGSGSPLNLKLPQGSASDTD